MSTFFLCDCGILIPVVNPDFQVGVQSIRVPAGTRRQFRVSALLVAQHALHPELVSVPAAVHDLVVVSGQRHAVLRVGGAADVAVHQVRLHAYSIKVVVCRCFFFRVCGAVDVVFVDVLRAFRVTITLQLKCFLCALVVLYRFFKSTTLLLVGFLLSSWVISAAVSLKLNYALELAEPLISFGFLYDMPWTRIGPYIMGKIKRRSTNARAATDWVSSHS